MDSLFPASSIPSHFVIITFGVFFYVAIYKLFLDPLRTIPGPWTAKFTNLWYLSRVRKAYFHKDNIALHEQHGSMVRYGPSRVSISDPASVKKVYGLGSNGLNKSSWYDGFNKPGVRSLFTERDGRVHAQMRRKFASTYSMSSMISYEGFVDECITLLCKRFDEMASSTSSHSLDMAWWMQCFAADTVSMVTYSKRMGFLDAGDDIQGLMAFLHENMFRSSQLGVYSWITPYVIKAFGILGSLGLGKATPITFVGDFAGKAIGERRQLRSTEAKEGKLDQEQSEEAPRDFLDKFLDFHERDPKKFDKMDLTVGLSANLVAGSDTTAASLAAVFYHLHRNPHIVAALRAEVDASFPDTNRLITFKEAQTLPYLQAVIQEALRMHPATGLCLERDVPQGGLELEGHFLPEGTIVGANPWVLHYSTSIFGDDAAVFRPERWLEAEPERLAAMKQSWMPFGLGSRTCIGRHVSMLEMTKVVPELVRRFQFELVGGSTKEWEVNNWWFVIPKALPMKISHRKSKS